MRTILSTLIAIAILSSCTKDNSSPNDDPTYKQYMNFKMDTSLKVYGAPKVTRNKIGSNELLDITGADGNGDWINLRIQKADQVTTGTYHAPEARIVVSSDSKLYTTDANADIIITASDSTHIEGYFDGTAKANNGNNSKKLKEGSFYVLL